MLRMSRLLQLYDGMDWFRRSSPSGGSPKGLLQYYIDTAYPIEQTGFGQGQIRDARLTAMEPRTRRVICF